jgi:signal transduction histidine kinase
MMNYGLFAALAIAFVLTAAAVLIFKRRGPWGAAWTFFLFLFLALWITSIYLPNVGPIYWGIAWVPILVVGTLLVFLLAAAIPGANEWRDESIRDGETSKITEVKTKQPSPGIRWYWILIAIMISLILVGMINPQKAL